MRSGLELAGRYRLEAPLGQGGMGEVWRGVDLRLRRPVAVKVIRRELAIDPGFRARFASEIANAQRVASFCTAKVLTYGESDGRPYLVTEFIEGPSLSDYIAEHGALPAEPLHALAVGIATALAAIHMAKLVHRDLKPANVILSASGPRVIDFGIARALDGDAKHTQTGFIVGSPGWIPPEQVFENQVSTAGDVFAWGTLIAYAATGRHPYGDGTLMVRAVRAHQGEHDLTGIPDDLRPLVTAALEADPARRPGAEQLLVGLIGETDPETAVSQMVEAQWASKLPAQTFVSPLPQGTPQAAESGPLGTVPEYGPGAGIPMPGVSTQYATSGYTPPTLIPPMGPVTQPPGFPYSGGYPAAPMGAAIAPESPWQGAAGQMPGQPSQGRRKGRSGLVLVWVGGPVAIVVVALIALLGMVFSTNDDHRHHATPPTRAASPTPASTVRTVSDLSGMCSKIGAGVPSEARSITMKDKDSVAGHQHCQWEDINTSTGRYLRLDIDTGSGSGDAAVADAGSQFSADEKFLENRKFHSGKETVSGLGDKALAARTTDYVDMGPGERRRKRYYIAGAEVVVMVRNVVIDIEWSGADYPSSVRGSDALHGTNFTYAKTKAEAITMAQEVIKQLPV
ncbi:protein kinase domain-containing protein [Actinoallomurus sp. CA-150999]|uniref:serine/threonine-protein kinase n=1 Tax=Actinoallomurus sp. CA-150999 TaxID=3239887 RepID=UPI003D8E64B9